ncbi:MAG: PAS domain S-box protein [Chloroflexi bacterium]|nr:PAS domain S-box protein [Chloroflexota bacterium]
MNEERMRIALQGSPIVVFNQDKELRYTWIHNLHPGFAIEQTLGKTDIDLLPAEDATNLTAIKRQVLESGVGTRKEVRTTIDGAAFFYDLTVEPLRDAVGNIIGITCSSMEITERKRAEEALRESEGHYRDLVEHSHDLFCTHDLEGVILSVNPAATRITGYPENELVSMNLRDVLVPAVRDQFADYLAEIKATGSATGQMLVQTKSGERRIWEYDNTLRTEGIVAPVVRGMARDITERKQAEETIKQQLAELASYYDNAPIGLAVLDTNLRFLRINNLLAEINGIPAAQHLGKTIKEIVPMLEEQAREVVSEIIKTGKPLIDIEFSGETAAQTGVKHVWLEGWYPLKSDNKEIVGFMVIVQDITERKRAEEALRESEERFRSLFENATIGVYRTTPSGRIELANPTLIRMLGYTSFEELAQRDLEQEGFEPSYPRAQFRERIEREGEIRGLESAWRARDGATVFVRESAQAIRDAEGRVLHYEGTVENVTERNRAEQALRESEERYRRLVELLPDGVVVHRQGRVIFANPASATIIGAASPADLIGKPVIEFVHPDYRELALKRIQQSLSEGVPASLADEKFVRLDGTPIDTEVSAIPFPYAGKPAMLTVFNDITERKRAEEALRESEDKFKYVFDHSIVGKSITLPSGEIGVNKAFCDMLGYTQEELQNQRWQDITHPDDIELTQGAMASLLSGKQDSARFSKRYIHKSGAVVWTDVSSSLRRDKEGNPLYFMTALSDITERKRQEAEILAAQAELERLLVGAEQSRQSLLSVVEDQKQTEAALQRQNALLAALQETAVELISQFDLDTLLKNVVKRAGLLAGTTAGYLDLVEPGSGQLMLRVGMGALAESLDHPVRPGEGVAGIVWQTGQPLVINDYDRWPGRVSGFSRNTLQAVIGVPLLSGGRVLGVLGLAHDFAAPRIFDQETVDLLTQFARLATIAIENARLFAETDRSRRALLSVVEDQKQAEEALRESNRRLAALNRVGLALAETLELPAICRTAYEHVAQLVDAPCFGISLYDASARLLRAGYLFSDGELLDSARFPPLIIEDAPPIQGRTRAILTQQPEIVTDLTAVLSEATIVVGAPDDQRVPLSALYVPITARGQTIGLLEMQSYRGQAYGDAEVGLLRPVANQIGLAIENARLFAELQVERDSLAQRVRDRTAQLQAANQELEAFAYSVSHDLRAPLRALDGFSAALLSHNAGLLDDQGRHYLDRIQQASQRMGQLISDLLNLSRVTRAELTRQPVDLAALAREIAAELQAREPQRQVEFAIAEKIIVQGDAHLLRIALENLMGNAWKFTGPRPQARIDFGLRISESTIRNPQSTIENPKPEIVYYVKDNGVGFDMAYANKLFAPFQRLHGVEEFPGTGIGLATVQRIVARHGGRIWPEAAVDGGAAFYFTLGGQ